MIRAVEAGDTEAAEQLLPVVYDELRRLANTLMQRENAGHTLEATALLHEAYVKLVGDEDRGWNDRRHFFNACALAMRRVLVDRARSKNRVKRGGGNRREHLDAVDIPFLHEYSLEDFDAVERALDELADGQPRSAEVMQLHKLVGLSLAQAAEVVGVSNSTAKNDYRFARLYIRQKIGLELGEDQGPSS